VKGGKAGIVVRWDGGREETVLPTDPDVKYAIEGSRRLEWLMKPNLFEDERRDDPAGVLVGLIRDEVKAISATNLKKALVYLGLTPAEAQATLEAAKVPLRRNRHVVITKTSYAWSDTPADPWSHLRSLPAHEALDRLVAPVTKLAPEEVDALEDAIRSQLPPR